MHVLSTNGRTWNAKCLPTLNGSSTQVVKVDCGVQSCFAPRTDKRPLLSAERCAPRFANKVSNLELDSAFSKT
ncbi:hypothetical protein LSTR_LSTR000377 [Laodelphax striatellus]|uniref:Uncharacterized protein n=1 Tax=Laodelphax striatellus TaxID=195883 RepID=A0A482X4R1_LAOST|nr:hypothetical protein LSTR_LSTR014771 [Laodelphax striatellus]RZF40498.1 hypothetical protein LSTR_LSTR000377 [Laodelphax striatellus]